MRFYYSWKKTRSRSSAMDRQEKKKPEGVSENGSENGSPEDSDVEDKVSHSLLLLSRSILIQVYLMKQLCSTIAHVLLLQKWPIRGIRRASRSPNRRNPSVNHDNITSSLASNSSKAQVLLENFLMLSINFSVSFKNKTPHL